MPGGALHEALPDQHRNNPALHPNTYNQEARFYDTNNRTWLAMDPIKDGGNWYQYCSSNPTTYYDPTGLAGFSPFSGCVDMNKLAEQVHSGVLDLKGKVSAFVDNID